MQQEENENLQKTNELKSTKDLEDSQKFSNSTKKRMILLLNLLENWGKIYITSKEIAELLGVKDSLIRYDFSVLNLPQEHRGYKNGYEVSVLEQDIRNALSEGSNFIIEDNLQNDNKKHVCIVGLGRLGAALLDDSFFENSDFKICAGFDSSLNRVELLRSTFELFPASKIESVCPSKKIEYAILCCPESEVQKMADRLVSAGIKGIVNYTNSVFLAPKTVKVQNVSPALALAMVE